MEQIINNLITGYIALMSIVGFAQMGIDKQRAVKKAWRIPERTLFLAALLGGSIGSFLGMYAFRHKTKHIKFVTILPLTACIDLFCILKLNHII